MRPFDKCPFSRRGAGGERGGEAPQRRRPHRCPEGEGRGLSTLWLEALLPGDGPAVRGDQIEAEAPGYGGVQADGAVV